MTADVVSVYAFTVCSCLSTVEESDQRGTDKILHGS